MKKLKKSNLKKQNEIKGIVIYNDLNVLNNKY